MHPVAEPSACARAKPWRELVWGAAGILLLLPLVAMQFTREVDWSLADFVIFGGMLLVACGGYELATRLSRHTAYRAAAAVALATGFALAWVNLAVGIIGSGDIPANLVYAGVLAVAIVGALLARLRPAGMATALKVTALAQASASAAALAAGESVAVLLSLLFALPWLASAWLFGRAAAAQTSRAA
jgi:hypothetical protein